MALGPRTYFLPVSSLRRTEREAPAHARVRARTSLCAWCAYRKPSGSSAMPYCVAWTNFSAKTMALRGRYLGIGP